MADDIRDVAFIVGMSRAGTTWMARSLNTHRNVSAFGETAFWGKGYIAPDSLGGYSADKLEKVISRLRQQRLEIIKNGTFSLDKAFTNIHVPITPGEVFQRFSEAICRAEETLFPVEKTPHHLIWIERILYENPNARFIVMKREPYGFMLSYKTQGAQKDDRVRRVFERQYHPLLAALIWKGYAKHLLSSIKKHHRQMYVIDLEDVKAYPEETLRCALSFLGVPDPDRATPLPKDNSSAECVSESYLKADDLFWMNLLSGRVAQKLGYSLVSVPWAPFPIVWSFIRLPIWSIQLMLSLFRRGFQMPLLHYIWRWVRSP